MTMPIQSCQYCSFEFYPTPENAHVTVYVKQPWFSFLTVTCPQCFAHQQAEIAKAAKEERQPKVLPTDCKLFFGPGEYTEWCMKCLEAGIGTMVEDYAPDDVVEWWSEAYERHPLAEHKLTQRLDEEVQKLGVLLEHIPDDLLWAELTDQERPHDKPESWC